VLVFKMRTLLWQAHQMKAPSATHTIFVTGIAGEPTDMQKGSVVFHWLPEIQITT